MRPLSVVLGGRAGDSPPIRIEIGERAATLSKNGSAYISRAMPVTLRAHEPRDFTACCGWTRVLSSGNRYSKMMLRYFLKLPSRMGRWRRTAARLWDLF